MKPPAPSSDDDAGGKDADEQIKQAARPSMSSVASDPSNDDAHQNPSETPSASASTRASGEDDVDVLRATQNSLRDAVGAFAVAGPDYNPEEEDAPSNSNSTGPHLPANIDIVAEATLVEPNEGRSGLDVSSVTRDVTIESAPTAVAVASGDAEAPPEASNTPNAPSGDKEPVHEAQLIDKYAIFACGRHVNIKKWHLALLGVLVVGACVAIPLGVVYGGTKDESTSEDPAEKEAPPAVPMELPEGVVPDPQCEFKLFENDSSFAIDSLVLDDEPIPPPEAGDGPRTVVARPGSKLLIKSTSATCSEDWCPTCLAQLYVSLMDYDGGNIYDPCQYIWSGQAVVPWSPRDYDPEIVPDLAQPDPDMTTKCLDNRYNSHCPGKEGIKDFTNDDVVFYFPDGEADATKEYVVVLSSSYEYQCQEDLKDNKLRILRVSDEYVFRIEGEPIEHAKEVIEEDVEEECEYQTRESNHTFTIDALYLNDAPVPKGSTVSAVPGDKIRVTGTAATCSPNWNSNWWAQLFVSILETDDGAIYDPCTYKHAGHEVLYEKEPGNLIRPPVESSGGCFYFGANGSCEPVPFDEEFAVEEAAAAATGGVGGGGEYRVVLSHTSEYYCQEELVENRLEILQVSEDYVLELEGGGVVNNNVPEAV
ncbi:hypothetical protein ACHAXT_008233 [Thalassiosira profunda]